MSVNISIVHLMPNYETVAGIMGQIYSLINYFENMMTEIVVTSFHTFVTLK